MLEFGVTSALTHHGGLAGRGDPNVLSGDAIPLVGRVAAGRGDGEIKELGARYPDSTDSPDRLPLFAAPEKPTRSSSS